MEDQNTNRMDIKLWVKLSIILIILIVCFLMVYQLKLKSPELNQQSDGISSDSSAMVTNMDLANPMNPTTEGQFWATMYRKDNVTNKIYFVMDRQRGLLKEIPGADPNSFATLAGSDGAEFSYASDKNGVYCNDTLRTDISKDTFVYNKWNALYAKDKSNVYVNCEKLEDADAATFWWLDHQGNGSLYARDKNKVYYKGIILPDADPVTFSLPGYSYSGYATDANNLYKKEKKVGKTSYKFSNTSTGRIIFIGKLVIFEEDGGFSNVIKGINNTYYEDENVYISGQKIYFINTQGALSYFEPKINLTSKIVFPGLQLLDKDNRASIVDYFINSDSIYFLYGQNCNAYQESCNLELYKYRNDTQVLDKIYSNVEARNIIGIDETTNDIYLQWADGDAGCFWTMNFIVNLNSRNLVKQSKISGCAGDDDGSPVPKEYTDASNEVEAFYNKVRDDVVTSNVIYVKNGEIIQPPKVLDAGEPGEVKYFNNF